MKNAREKRVTVTSRIYDGIKSGIINGEFKVGTSLEEVELTKRFKVSRTPVRAALSRLECEGLVSGIPNKGFSIPKLSVQEFYEICLVRELLEGYAAEIASARLTQPDFLYFDRIKRDFEELLQEISSGNNVIARHNALDLELHYLILRVAGNATVERIIQNLREKIQQIRLAGTPERLRASILEHLIIIETLKSRDGEACKKAMIEHLTGVRKDTYKLWS